MKYITFYEIITAPTKRNFNHLALAKNRRTKKKKK